MTSSRKRRLLFLIAEDHYVISHRLGLAIAAKAAGFEVAIATRCQQYQAHIESFGIEVFPLKHMGRSGLNPIQQCLLILELIQIYRNFKPDITHHVAMKPVILGSFVALLCKVPRIINALGGLGYLFIENGDKKVGSQSRLSSNPHKNASLINILKTLKKSSLKVIVSRLLKILFSSKNCILILQNDDDIKTLVSHRILKPNQSNVKRIMGAGVNLTAFPLTPIPSQTSPIIISCVSRMLWDKGIGELVYAATILKEWGANIEVRLHGAPDLENPATISESQLRTWNTLDNITWLGHCQEVARAYAECHIAVLPSYREGLPKSLLEAMSCGRPIVTTDVPGCREVVQQGVNGSLVPARDGAALADALFKLIQDSNLREQMGKASRQMVEQHFSDTIIHQHTLALYR